MGREFELKYRAQPHSFAALEAAYGPFREIAMETTYYDTPDRSLSARKWTLRRRLENGRSICTLKTPLAGRGRGEWEWEGEDLLAAVPELCNLGAPEELISLVQQGIVPVCGARFARKAAFVTWEGSTLELALDQGVLLGGGRELPILEVEAELKEGTDEALLVYCTWLARKYGLMPEAASKYRRALDLAKNEQTEK